MTTANQIIRAALGKLGVVSPGQSVNPGDAQDCLSSLNTLLDSWRLESLYAYTTQTVTATIPAGAQSVLIGPSATINVTPRPVRIEGGLFRLSGTDQPFQVVNDDDWNAITVKDVGAASPSFVNYRATLPSGELRIFPKLAAAAVALLDVQVQLTAFADLTTNYPLAPGYERALLFSLAEEVAADYEREIPPTVARNAANARRLVKRANHVVPQLAVGPGPDYTTSRAYLFGGA